jgi:hypothetical protein
LFDNKNAHCAVVRFANMPAGLCSPAGMLL